MLVVACFCLLLLAFACSRGYLPSNVNADIIIKGRSSAPLYSSPVELLEEKKKKKIKIN
jgi:hypothetical protein